MTSNIITVFLDRHNSELVERFGTYLASESSRVPTERMKNFIAPQVVQFYIGRMLGTVSMDSELSQAVIAGTLRNGVPPEQIRLGVEKFFAILNELATTDSALSKTELAHVQRVLEQSRKFLLIDIFSFKPSNLKKD